MRISDWSSDVCSSDLESRRSATVAKLDLRRLIHVFETISELEGLCARFAARRMTASERGELSDSHAAAEVAMKNGNAKDYARLGRRFHSLVIQATHNDVLAQTTAKLAQQPLPYRQFQFRPHGRTLDNHRDHGRNLEG